MSPDRTQDFLASLVHEPCRLPRETEWVEFKHNDAEPEEIGETPFEAGIAKEHACAEDDAVHPMVGCPQSRPMHLMSSRRFESLRGRLFNSACKWPILYRHPYLMGT